MTYRNETALKYPNSVGASLRIREMNRRRETPVNPISSQLQLCSHIIQKQSVWIFLLRSAKLRSAKNTIRQ